MRIFIFRSETRENLHALAGDAAGSRLPERVGPWRLISAAPAGAPLPYSIPRPGIEKAIRSKGFQLWRLRAAS